MWVLWAYWPRRMVARPGQHRGEVEVMLVNSTPWLVMLLLRAGMAFWVPGNWSSVRTKTMLGLGAAAPDLAEPSTTTSTTTLATSTAVVTEANSRTALPIPTRPSLVRRNGPEDPTPSRNGLMV